ncbi:MAG: hypothetical protein V1692_01800 [bacterium]
MPLGLKITFIVLIGLAIIFGLVWYWFSSQGQPVTVDNTTNQPQVNSQQNLPTELSGNNANVTVPTQTAPAVSSTDKTKSTLARLASSFTERFGSYSNQSNYTNFEDLYDFMTSPMKSWAQTMVAELRDKNSTGNNLYFGLTTKSLSAKVTAFDETAGQAEILVKTQRREATGTTSNARIYYQDMVIKMVNENGVWKVDGAFWQ